MKTTQAAKATQEKKSAAKSFKWASELMRGPATTHRKRDRFTPEEATRIGEAIGEAAFTKAPKQGQTKKTTQEEQTGDMAEAFANLDAAIASTPETHPDYEKLTGKKALKVPPGGAIVNGIDPITGEIESQSVLDADTVSLLEQIAAKQGKTPSETLEAILTEAFEDDTIKMPDIEKQAGVARKRVEALMETLGLGRRDLHSITFAAGIEAMEREAERNGEITVPLHLSVVSGNADLVPVMIPKWIEQRLIATACAANIKGGPLRLLEVELGVLVDTNNGAEFFHQGLLDGWDYEPAELVKARKDLAALRRRWDKEDAKKGGPEA